MKTLNLRSILGLQIDNKQILEDSNSNLYILENGILYDVVFDNKYRIAKGSSHRMSKLNIVIN